VVCDSSQIQQVLTAIIINAVDAIVGAGRAHGNVRMRAAALEDKRVDLSVTNDGPPIPADVLPKIFEPFFSTKQAASGVGLGLSVAYGIVKRHGGEIQVETGPETTFHVILPVGDSGSPSPRELEKTDVGQVVHSDR
jgi:signal transduction histidine kinase